MMETTAKKLRVAIIGGGPAGLMAAEVIASAGIAVDVYEAKPSVGRKFLIAGKGGLNLTHSEPREDFISRFEDRAPQLGRYLVRFGPDELRAWAEKLGYETFVGTSGRVFPVGMKAAPLLRAWLSRLKASGVQFHFRHYWLGWSEAGELLFTTGKDQRRVRADAVVLALGGASWPELGSDGSWTAYLQEKEIALQPLVPANCGFDVNWSAHMKNQFAGAPVKSVVLLCEKPDGSEFERQGEFVISEHGVEGSLVYAASRWIRENIDRDGSGLVYLDLAPDRSVEDLSERLARSRGSKSLATHLQRQAGIKGVKSALLREFAPQEAFQDPRVLAEMIKRLPVRVESPRPIEEAISTAGGVRFEELDERLMLKKMPGVFCAGEMLDWEAPTGGYLLTASFSTGRAAGEGVLKWLSLN